MSDDSEKFKKLDGCPCGTHGKCCTDPVIVRIEHDEHEEGFCEDCCGSECATCGGVCYCDV